MVCFLWVLFRLATSTTGEEPVSADLSVTARDREEDQKTQDYRTHCRARSITPWFIIPEHLVMTMWAEWQKGKNKTNAYSSITLLQKSAFYSELFPGDKPSWLPRVKRHPVMRFSLLHFQRELLLTACRHITSGKDQGTHTLLFSLCKSWLPISKPSSRFEIWQFRIYARSICFPLGLSRSQVQSVSRWAYS